jgi:signal transduction histidine kinase
MDKDLDALVAAQATAARENARLYQALKDGYEQLKINKAYLARAGDVPELGNRLREMCHSLNNIMVGVIGSLDLLKGKIKDENLQQYVSGIAQKADEAAAVVRNLGKMAREIAGYFNGLPALPSEDILAQWEQLLATRNDAADKEKNQE